MEKDTKAGILMSCNAHKSGIKDLNVHLVNTNVITKDIDYGCTACSEANQNKVHDVSKINSNYAPGFTPCKQSCIDMVTPQKTIETSNDNSYQDLVIRRNHGQKYDFHPYSGKNNNNSKNLVVTPGKMENKPISTKNSLTKVLGDTSLKVNNCIIHPYTDDTSVCSSCKRKEKIVCSKCSDD